MKIIYHLQALRYNFTKSEFEDFDFNTALKYCKLVYKDKPTFQKELLSKMKNNSDLEKLRLALEINFENAIPLKKKEILNIKDKKTSDFAMLHFHDAVNTKIEKLPTQEKLHKYYIKKIQNFLENKSSSFFQPKVISDLVENKAPFYINNIKKDSIKSQEEYIYYTIKNVDKLYLNEGTKYLVCSFLSLKKIKLNDELLFLHATSNQIKNIKLNDKLQELNIASNNLKSLQCNSELKSLNVSDNKLEKLTLNPVLKNLVCASNNLKYLELNEHLEEANLLNNPLQNVKINKNLKSLSISHPENKKITIHNSILNQDVLVHYFIN